MEFTSLVAVKSKTGELNALSGLKQPHVRNIRICVELVAELRASGGDLLGKLSKAALRLYDLGKTMLLDASQLHATSGLWRKPGGPLGFASEYLVDQFGLLDAVPFVPVVSSMAPDEQLRDVALVREQHDCMVALRVPTTALPAAEARSRVQHCLDVLKVDASAVLLLIDATYIAGSVDRLVPACARLARELSDSFTFESVTVLGGAVPTSKERARLPLDAYERPELHLWRGVAARVPSVRYGDYGVVHPVAQEPPKGTPMNTPNPYMFYTAPGKTRFCLREMARKRGRPLPGEHPEAYFQQVAEELVDSDEYRRSATDSVGDRWLFACAQGDKTASTSKQWIEIGTSRHIAHLAANDDDRSVESR